MLQNPPPKNQFGSGTDCYQVIDKYTKEGVSLVGKTVIITGSNTGLGKETSKAFAGMKAKVIMACRDVKKGELAMEEIKAALPEANLRLMKLDLSSFESVRKFVEEIKEPVSLLINNAGVMACPYEETKDGFEMQFGTNHLGHFLLTNLLIPRLKEGSPSRVVNVSSAAHRMGSINFEDLSGKGTWYDGYMGWGSWVAYGQSKTANILFAYEFNRRMKEAGNSIISVSLHPGGIKTDLQRSTRFGFIMNLFSFLFKSIPQGSATSVYCAIAPEVEQLGGSYFYDCNYCAPQAYALNPESATKLWDLSEKFTHLNDKQ